MFLHIIQYMKSLYSMVVKKMSHVHGSSIPAVIAVFY